MPAQGFQRTTESEVERRLFFLIALSQAAPSASQRPVDLTTARSCETQASQNEDVIVCGRGRDDSNRYRLPPPSQYQAENSKAEVQLGKGTRMSAETENVTIGGAPSNRVMIRLKFKF